MTVDDALIDKLARLSMLRFDDAEKEAIRKDLEKMIGFVDKLKELDTGGIAPLQHMGDARDAYREDVVGEGLDRTTALGNASHHDEQFFKVPKVIKK